MASVFIERVVLRNYKSIAHCDVALGPLSYFVGANGSGKSNFLDALHLVSDALSGSLDNAMNERSGLGEVRRRSGGHPNHFGIRHLTVGLGIKNLLGSKPPADRRAFIESDGFIAPQEVGDASGRMLRVALEWAY